MFSRSSRFGFTLIELLVVIAIISILVALVTIAAGMMLQRSKSTKDLGNHRMFGIATFSHATDHYGKLLHPVTGPFGWPDPSTSTMIERYWIAAHGQDANGLDRLVNTGGEWVEMLTALQDGAAYQYIGDVAAFHSPMDPTIGDLDSYVNENIHEEMNKPKDRVRSYALNAFVGVEWGADDWTEYRDNYPLNLLENGYWRATETLSQIPQPAGTMCSIGEEDSTGRNAHGWLISPSSPYWNDFPAFWDNRRINISFVDGSTGAIILESDELKKRWLQYGHNDHNPNSCQSEYKALRRVLLPGVIGSVLN